MKNDKNKENIGTISPRPIDDEMRESYLDYAMSVIIARALPDVRDGLKPVQRRILYTMKEMGLTHASRFRKSAAVVGDCLGKYHPHGDISVYDAMVRMAQDFSLRYPLVEGQGNFGCFTKDTKVRLTDGRNLSFEELIKEYKKGKRNWTFTFNSKTKKIEITEIKKPRLTKKSQKIIEITLDNGEKIKCTLDHRFMLRDGAYKQAKDLKPEDSLMPLYSKSYNGKEDVNLNGYEIIYQPIENGWKFVHHLADQWNLGDRVYEKSAGRIRHHNDFNKLNNNPNNIKRIQWQDHWKLHKEIASKRHKNDPEYVEKIAEGRRKFWAKKENRMLRSQLQAERNRKMWQSPKYRKMWSEARKKLWQDHEYRGFMREVSSKNMKELWGRKDFQELMSRIKSEELKKRWQGEDYRIVMREWTRKASLKIWSNPKHREYMSKLIKERFQDPKEREKQSKISKKLWGDPNYRAQYSPDHFSKMAKKLWENPEVKEFHREKAIRQWQDERFREKVIKTVRARNRQRMKENPLFMETLTSKAKVALHKNWKDPHYKEKVIKSKILGYVYSLLNKHNKVTVELYEKKRTANWVPRIEKALDYFESFPEILTESKKYNHKIVSARILSKREDVYDLIVEPWHNFALASGIFVHNSVDGDSQAAMRYTEARLSKIAEEALANLDENTVNFVDNYDGTRQEPVVLPSRVPALLLNGTMGIAVGMATQIPPHNLTEVADALIHLIDRKDANVGDLLKFISGPDFPTGGIIYNQEDIEQAYATGRGPLVIRAKTEIVEKGENNFSILVTEIPFLVNKASLLEKIADLVHDKKIEGIKDLRDESDREGIRIVIELKKDAYPNKILNQLFQYTELQTTFHFNTLALVDGIQPRTLNLKEILEEHIKHRQNVIRRRTEFNLARAEERAHILQGLKRAIDKIDSVIKLIKKSKDREAAKEGLMKKFKFTDRQAVAILEMKLQQLANLERKKVEDELKEKLGMVKEFKDILARPKKILGLIKDELKELKEKYGGERRTKVVKGGVKEFKAEDLIPNEPTIITVTKAGYIKRLPPDTFKVQERGGKGVKGLVTSEGDVVEYLVATMTHADLLFFTTRGRVFELRAHEVPVASRTAKGQLLVNFLQLAPEEKVSALLTFEELGDYKYLTMVTKKGVIKKTDISEFENIRRSGLIAIKLKPDDYLEWVKPSSGGDEVFLVTAGGQAIRFKEKGVRAMGRSAAGVRGIRLKKDDEVVGMDIIEKTTPLTSCQAMVIMEHGFGKRTACGHYRIQGRGGTGIKTAKVTSKTGKIVSAYVINTKAAADEDLIIISEKGQVIRLPFKSISTLGRATQGVRVMRFKEEGDRVASVTFV